MSAEVLREAAASMRSRAEAARANVWYADGANVLAAWRQPRPITTCDGSDVPDGNVLNAEHIASWHPAVALLTADLLDVIAQSLEARGVTAHIKPSEKAAFAVARAYLGGESS